MLDYCKGCGATEIDGEPWDGLTALAEIGYFTFDFTFDFAVDEPSRLDRVTAWIEATTDSMVEVLRPAFAFVTIVTIVVLALIGTLFLIGDVNTYSGPDGDGTLIALPDHHNVAVFADHVHDRLIVQGDVS